MKRLTLIIILFNFSGAANSQKTSEELGKAVFEILKSNTIQYLDTLIPTSEEAVQIYKNQGFDVSKLAAKDFSEKYYKHISKLKTRFQRLRDDTVHYNINWFRSEFGKTIIKDKVLYNEDSTIRLKSTILEILFTNAENKYIIKFYDVFNYNNVWKLGEDMSFNKSDEVPDKRQ